MPSILVFKWASLFLLVKDFLRVNFPNLEYEKFMQINERLTLEIKKMYVIAKLKKLKPPP